MGFVSAFCYIVRFPPRPCILPFLHKLLDIVGDGAAECIQHAAILTLFGRVVCLSATDSTINSSSSSSSITIFCPFVSHSVPHCTAVWGAHVIFFTPHRSTQPHQIRARIPPATAPACVSLVCDDTATSATLGSIGSVHVESSTCASQSITQSYKLTHCPALYRVAPPLCAPRERLYSVRTRAVALRCVALCCATWQVWQAWEVWEVTGHAEPLVIVSNSPP